jgi:N-acetylmuramoyl-L-alanine amidase
MLRKLKLTAFKLAAAMATLVVLTIGGARKGGAREQPSPGWITLFSGHSITFRIDKLASGELYAVSAYLAGPPRRTDQADLLVTIADEQGELANRDLDSDARYLSGIAQPRRNGSIYVNLSAGGEPEDIYTVKLDWLHIPVPATANALKTGAIWTAVNIPPDIDGALFIPSPNQEHRLPTAKIDTIVVHATVIESTEKTAGAFYSPVSRVSAHYVVGRDGMIVQQVPESERAWHAGVWALEGRTGVNDFSVGIEMVNLNDGKDPYPDVQYQAVARIIKHIRSKNKVPDKHIVSHEFVARPKGRKNDPMGFDFERLKRMCR